MPQTLRIAFRFLTAKKRAMLMSLALIVFGVGLFIVTQASASGFEGFFIKTILGTNGAARVEDRIQNTSNVLQADGWGDAVSKFEIKSREGRKYIEGIEEPAALTESLKGFRNVDAVSEVLTGAAVIGSGLRDETIRLFGIRIDDHAAVSDLENQILAGSLDGYRETPRGLIVGMALAERIDASVGDSVLLTAAGEGRRYQIAAIYRTGVTDIDRQRVYLHLGEARSLLKKPTGASFLQVSLRDVNRAPQDCVLFEETLGHSASSWQEREKTWLEVFRALRVFSAITILTFLVIAGLGMFNTLAIIVMEKTKEIAILRSMGYTRRDISRIFLWQAALVLAAGALLGCAVGAAITYAVSRLPIRVRGIFSTDTFVVAWSADHYLLAVAAAALVVFVASLAPARRAARLEPGDVVRGTAQ